MASRWGDPQDTPADRSRKLVVILVGAVVFLVGFGLIYLNS